MSDPRKPPRAGADYTAREVTRPGTGRHPRLTVDELADTRDESTPVRDLVADMEAARETLGSLVADDLRRSELWDLPSTQWARRIVDDIAALKAAADRSRDTDRDRADFVERLAAVEADLRHHREYQLKLSGVADGNGRLGAMDRTIAAIREDLGTSKERAAERATIKAVRWSTAKLLALVGVVAVSAGGGIVTTLRARDVIAHAEGRREQRLDDFEREVGRRFDAVNVDLDRLYLLFKMPRTAPQEPHE